MPRLAPMMRAFLLFNQNDGRDCAGNDGKFPRVPDER